MTIERMDNVGIVVENLDAAIEFFTELGLELEPFSFATGLPKHRIQMPFCARSDRR